MSIIFKKNTEIFPYLYSEIEKSRSSLKIAVAWLTDPELLKLLLNKKFKENIDVKLILFNDLINLKLKETSKLEGSLYYSKLSDKAIMHHKFAIIDDKSVITGSYNWTIKARRFNRENILHVHDDKIVDGFSNEFENLIKNSQHVPTATKSMSRIDMVEDEYLLELEQKFNKEIFSKIDASRHLNVKIDISLVYKIVEKNTPVIAATRLASAENGDMVQSGLRKLLEVKRLDLSFEDSIIKNEFAPLFKKETIEFAQKKLSALGYFKTSNLF